MRKVAVILNALVAIISLALLIATFALEGRFFELAEDFVFTKTLEHSDSAASLVEKYGSGKLVETFVKSETLSDVKKEVKRYRSGPEDYVNSLVRAEVPTKIGGNRKGTVEKFKEGIQSYFRNALDSIIRDIRIVNGSNLIFSLFAAALVLTGGARNEKLLLTISFAVFGATLFSTMIYVYDGYSIFDILFESYLGFMYPVILITVSSCWFFAPLWSAQNPDLSKKGESAES